MVARSCSKSKSMTKEQAIQKLKHYCTYQERSHMEVKQKLYTLRVPKSMHDEILGSLIEDDYLNEERFAKQYAGGKWRMKKWGRNKIIQKLREKHISPYVVNAALKEIDEDEYLEVLKNEAGEKYRLLKHEQYLIRRKKTADYLLQKGFEADLVNSIIKSVIQEQQA